MINNRFLILFFFANIFIFTNCEKDTPVIETTPPVVIPPTTNPPPVEKGDQRIAFYNVENLFDTTDDPNNEKDDEFLPDAPKKWTVERYQQKLENIGKVMQELEFPVLMGFAEVENRTVLEDLINSDLLKNQGYGIVHFDSPDFRGIDVALIYKTANFTLISQEAIEVKLPLSVSQFSTTRDILKVEGTLNGETLYLFVNHWPSRSGGVSATNEKRKFVAGILKKEIDDILAEDPNATIIVMGDLNDEPFNDSVLEILKAQTEKPESPDNQLYNCTIPLTTAGEGTYNFQGDWQMIDQMIVSGRLLDEEGKNKILGFKAFKDELVLFEHPENGLSPDRTYGGDNYFGGFSDHLAVFLEVKIR